MVRKHCIAIELVGLNKIVQLKMAKPPTQSTTSDASSSTTSSGDGKPPTQSTTSDASASLASLILEMRPKDTIADVKAKIAKQLGYSGELSWERNPLPDEMTGQDLKTATELLAPMLYVVDQVDLLNGVVEEANDDDDDSD